jgi:hypothetical protein
MGIDQSCSLRLFFETFSQFALYGVVGENQQLLVIVEDIYVLIAPADAEHGRVGGREESVIELGNVSSSH